MSSVSWSGIIRILTSVGAPFANTDNDVTGLLLFALEVVVQDDLGTLSISGLRVQSGPRVVGNHAVSATEGVLHRAPNVVSRCGLLVPDVSGVATKLAGLERSGDSVLVADGATSGVDEPSPLEKPSQYVRKVS